MSADLIYLCDIRIGIEITEAQRVNIIWIAAQWISI